MKKIIILLILAFLTISCTQKNPENIQEDVEKKVPVAEKKVTNNQLTQESEKTMEEQIADVKMPWEEYWDLAVFIKANLDNDEKQAIIEILEQRKQRQIEINNIIDKAVEEGNFKEKFEKIKEKRSVCASRILPYVIESKKDKFLKICENGNIKLQALYLSKMKKRQWESMKKNNETKKNISDKIREINEKKNEKTSDLKEDEKAVIKEVLWN